MKERIHWAEFFQLFLCEKKLRMASVIWQMRNARKYYDTWLAQQHFLGRR